MREGRREGGGICNRTDSIVSSSDSERDKNMYTIDQA